MPRQLELEILSQPDDMTCGPTCLHAVYRYYDDEMPLPQVIRESVMLDEGGTLAVLLGCHALRRGYRATIYTYNLDVFDPSWFVAPGVSSVVDGSESPSAYRSEHRGSDGPGCLEISSCALDVCNRLHAQLAVKHSPKLRAACRAYFEFLELGGRIRMRDLNASLIRQYLKRSIPILTGLSSTYLYRCKREIEPGGESNDVLGVPNGHFVVLCGYDKQRREVRVADPYHLNPFGAVHYYEVPIDRLICAILLGVLTYDANLLLVEPDRKLRSGGGKQD